MNPAALAADGNLNGTVDASDYILWRKNTTAPAAASWRRYRA